MLAVPDLHKNNHPLYVTIQPQPGMREIQLYNLDEFILSSWHGGKKLLDIISRMSEKKYTGKFPVETAQKTCFNVLSLTFHTMFIFNRLGISPPILLMYPLPKRRGGFFGYRSKMQIVWTKTPLAWQ